MDQRYVNQSVVTYQQLKQPFEHHSFGLHRDDGLAILKGLLGPETERVKKKVIKLF